MYAFGLVRIVRYYPIVRARYQKYKVERKYKIDCTREHDTKEVCEAPLRYATLITGGYKTGMDTFTTARKFCNQVSQYLYVSVKVYGMKPRRTMTIFLFYSTYLSFTIPLKRRKLDDSARCTVWVCVDKTNRKKVNTRWANKEILIIYTGEIIIHIMYSVCGRKCINGHCGRTKRRNHICIW